MTRSPWGKGLLATTAQAEDANDADRETRHPPGGTESPAQEEAPPGTTEPSPQPHPEGLRVETISDWESTDVDTNVEWLNSVSGARPETKMTRAEGSFATIFRQAVAPFSLDIQ